MCLRRYVRSYYKHNVRSFAIIVCYVQAYLFTPTISGRFTSHVPLAFILISKTKRILDGNIKNAEAAVLRRTNTGYRWSALTYFANVLRYSASICSSSLSQVDVKRHTNTSATFGEKHLLGYESARNYIFQAYLRTSVNHICLSV